MDFARRLGHKHCQILRDQEPALKMLVDKAETKLRLIGIQADPRDAPRYSHASLGHMGQMQQMAQKQLRCIRTDVHVRYGLWLSPIRPAWPWLIRHAVWLLDRFALKGNSHTCYEDAFGTVYKGVVLKFLECCLFRRPKLACGDEVE